MGLVISGDGGEFGPSDNDNKRVFSDVVGDLTDSRGKWIIRSWDVLTPSSLSAQQHLFNGV